MSQPLTISLPESYVSALRRRHHGRELPAERVAELTERMKMFYTQWQKAKKRLDNLHIFWDTANVEAYFREPKWYNAHARLRRYEREVKEAHRGMFCTLLAADGNSESFDSFWCIGAEDIYADFMSKYGHNENCV